MSQTIIDLGELGTTDGIVYPLEWTLLRGSQAWNLSGYTGLTLKVRNMRTHATVAATGTVAVIDAASGLVRYTPADGDPFYTSGPGVFEMWVEAVPSGGTIPEPSGRARYAIGVPA